MKATTLSDFASRCRASLSLPGKGAEIVSGITQDTRSIQPGQVYLALRGERHDGHDFVADAAARGAIAAVVEAEAGLCAPADFPLLRVGDSLAALHRLAASWRADLRLRVAAITGSSGKTTTKEMLASILARAGKVTSTRGNLNNHIGLPLSILAADDDDDFAVWEMGMNHAGEIRPLAALACPEVGIITNIGTAHIEFLGSREGIANEKAELFRAMPEAGCCVYPGDDDFAAVLREAGGSRRSFPVFFERGEPRAENVRPGALGTDFDLVMEDGRFPVSLQVAGRHMVVNALLAARAAALLGVESGQIAAGLSEARTVGGRMRRLSVRGLEIFDDTYNANPDSMVAALRTLSEVPLSKGVRRIAVLGKMGELGAHAAEGCERVGRAAAAHVDVLVATGSDAFPIAESARAASLADVFTAPDTSGAAAVLRSIARPGDLVLLKGSRSARMEEILPLLEPSTDS